ncbi:MAG: class I SAM-dependent rRNA methyltransferase [Deltaproteobacteria bacterium]|nr:class I SAM-dependent rRNA methyltransferase [Deltaproteobacteria bacterium]
MVAARVGSAGAKRLRTGVPWVFRADLERAPDAPPGAVVRVVDGRNNFLGQAFWSARSPIALRLLTRREEERVDAGFFFARLSAALERRRLLYPGADAFRVVHGESDLLPGLIVDRFADGVTVQLISEGMDAHESEILEAVEELLAPRLIALRNDTSAREFECLPRASRLAKGGPSAAVEYHEGENLFAIDLMGDLKTGAFLDQRENHLRAAEYARGEGLDCFTYHGGFALALARRCTRVLAVDQLEAAAARVGENARRNGLENVEARCANAFDVLRELEQEGRRFEVVVIDPPAFAKRKEGLAAAERAYKELNLRALRLLAPEGVLITCSCSGKMTPELFGRMLQSAIEDAKRPVVFLERRAAGRDHPALAGLPESDYLKCWVLRAL